MNSNIATISNCGESINLKVVKFELDFSKLLAEKPPTEKKFKKIKVPKITINHKKKCIVPPPPLIENNQKREIKELVEELLDELYADQREWSEHSGVDCRGSVSAPSFTSSYSNYGETEAIELSYLESLDIAELRVQDSEVRTRLRQTGERLAKCLRARDRLRRHQKRLCGAFTVLLRHLSGVSGARFSVTPSGGEGPGEGGYAEWHQAMRLVARLPAGVPHHFRRKLWLTLSERHLTARGVDWPSAERACFKGTAQPDDTELGAQIIKDLHRTGCSLFCGAEGRENQGMLRRVLLAYARWNKEVGYCQGFNMLAAIILEVMDKSESDSLKVMIYLVEAVLPEGYFADDLRGLSADMAAFRDLLRLRLPRLARHMDYLQKISDGGGVEPPLPDVFTMQWFLTLYATWLPRECLLRIWDLVLLDGNEVLLLTALAIWDLLQDRILSARSADEFYSCMGGGAGVIWEAGEALVARVVAFGSAPELPRLRNLHRYRVAPPAPPTSAPIYQPPLHTAMQSMTKRGLRLFYSEDEGDSSDDGNKLALATVIPRREDRTGAGDRLSLDIGALKRQYARLRERQRQAHVILAAACARHAAVGVPTSPTSLTVNNLLLGKSAIVSSRGRRLGPPPGAIPPSRQSRSHEKTESRSRVHSRSTDTISWHEEKDKKTLSRRNSVKWKDIKTDKKNRKASIDLDETGDGVIVSEIEANEMIATLRSRSSSETSSYSSHSESSTDTSLCDDNERGSESDVELPDDDIEKKHVNIKKIELPTSISPNITSTKISHTPLLNEPVISNSSSYSNIIDSEHNSVKDINDYLDSAAGEPLRTYIDEFESKLKNDNSIVSDNKSLDYDTDSTFFTPKSPYNSKTALVASSSPSSVLQLDPLSSTKRTYNFYDNISMPSRTPESIKNVTSPRLPQTERRINIHDTNIMTNSNEISRIIPPLPLIPNLVSPLHSSLTSQILNRISDSNKADSECLKSKNINRASIFLSPVNINPDCDFLSNLKSPTKQIKLSHERPPDIIDSFAMYANFVPDIDLSDNNSPDNRSSPRSPDAESLIVSEDEPPIPLKIDKYFEHSPEFFGARVTDPNNTDIPNRRSTRRLSRLPKKPDSLTLQSNHNEKSLKDEVERASSLPQSHSFTKKLLSEDESENEVFKSTTLQKEKTPVSSSPKDYIIQAGRKNSERALQIIQENSKILSRILTKQHITDAKAASSTINNETLLEKPNYFARPIVEKPERKLVESPILKESTSDSLIGCRKRNVSDEVIETRDFVRIRPISIDDPFSLEARNIIPTTENFPKNVKSPSIDCLGNKTDTYGWENKGFLAKCDRSPFLEKSGNTIDFDYKRKTIHVPCHEELSAELKPATTAEWSRHSFSGESKTSKTSVTFPSSEGKDASTYERKFTSDECNYPPSSKYNDYMLSEASDIGKKHLNQLVCENLLKTDDSQASDFAHVVTSSISFTYEPSIDDDSPTGAKSNSSDTLCQITSLDQVSTPISPKMFPVRDTPTMPRDSMDKSDTVKFDSDDTCSAITSLLETDTLSSLSFPRSPSTGSYHPFPTRPMRMSKELGVKLGMYPKETINSAPK